MGKLIRFILKLNFKSVYFNFKYFKWRKAIKFPVLISKHVILKTTNGSVSLPESISTGMIQIGYGDVGIFDKKRSKSIWEVSGQVVFKGTAQIGHGSKISVGENGSLEIGHHFIITAESTIVVHKKIHIGKGCLISWDCLIIDTDFHKIFDNTNERTNPPSPVVIGDNVWIGVRNLILKGSFIPNNVVIGANSLIAKALTTENSIYAGNPIKLIKENITWQR
jgi:carbonic anhydrase/acetyltransferase-like protein (isoleucine patch superfamily)